MHKSKETNICACDDYTRNISDIYHLIDNSIHKNLDTRKNKNDNGSRLFMNARRSLILNIILKQFDFTRIQCVFF